MDMSNISEVLDVVTSVIGVAAIFASVIPQPYGGVLLVLKKTLDIVAMNVGKAKNAK